MVRRFASVAGIVCALGAVVVMAFPVDADGAFPRPRPQASVIAGEVTDSNGDLAVGIEVNLKSIFGLTLKTRTDSNGQFAFTNLTPGRYKVSVCDGVDAVSVSLGGPDIFVFLRASCVP